MGYYDFPHTRNYDTDLGYLIKRYFELSTDFESLEKNFNDLKAWCVSQLNSEALKTLVANKLDEWLQDGTLEALINNPLNHVTTYDTVVEMLTHSALLEGSKIYCTGADSVNDGKGGHFRIRARQSTDVIDNYNLYLIDGGVKVAERLDSGKSEDKYIFMADSYGNFEIDGKHYSWTEAVINRLDIADRTINLSVGSRGFLYHPVVGTFRQGLSELNNDNNVKTIIVCGGANDISGIFTGAITKEDLIEEIRLFIETAKAKFPNAVVKIGMISNSVNSNHYDYKTQWLDVLEAYKSCVKFGAIYLDGVECILSLREDNYGVHPNANGFNKLYDYMVEAVQTNRCNVIYDNMSLPINFDNGITSNMNTIIVKQEGRNIITYQPNKNGITIVVPAEVGNTDLHRLEIGTISTSPIDDNSKDLAIPFISGTTLVQQWQGDPYKGEIYITLEHTETRNNVVVVYFGTSPATTIKPWQIYLPINTTLSTYY